MYDKIILLTMNEKIKLVKIKWINNSRKNMNASRRIAWDKIGSNLGFGDKIRRQEKFIKKLKKKWNITDDELENILPFTPVRSEERPNADLAAYVDGKIVKRFIKTTSKTESN